MTTQVQFSAGPSRRRVVALSLVAAAVVAIIANSLVSVSALAAGAGPAFAPLTIAVYAPFTVLGLLVGYAGWSVVARRVANPLRTLRVVVPALLVLSFIPDIISMAVGFIPDSSVTGFVALMLMHPVVVAVGVPVYQRLRPVR